MLQKFGIADAKPVTTPLAQPFKLLMNQSHSTAEERLYMSRVPYANVVGCVMYAVICSRPDLAHSVSVVSRSMANSGKEHYQALK